MTADALADELGLNPDERRLVAGLLRLGVSAEQIRLAARRGRLDEAIFEQVLDPERERRTVSLADVEAGGGLPVTEIQATLRGFGLPPPTPEQPYFTPEEADAFRRLGRIEDVWPREVRLEVARVYGQALARIARTELHMFRARVEPILRDVAPSSLDALAAVRQAFGWLLPLADPMLLGVHRRKIEQEMTQAAVWAVESEAEGLVPGTVDVCLLFLDLRHFTAYANRHGDATAIEVLDRFAIAVEENLRETGRLVKQLGDGYMLAFPAPDAAIDSALEIAEAMRGREGPALHVGLHWGQAVFRDGDYFGRAVNLAARLLSIAGEDELLATAGIAEATPERSWQRRGRRRLVGFGEAIEVFGLSLRGVAT